MRPFRPVSLVCAALAVTGLLGACGGSGKAAKPSAAFCTSLSNFLKEVQASGSATDLATAKKEFPTLVSDAQALTSPPKPAKGDVTSASSDLTAMNNWLQTKATPAEYGGSSAPAAIATQSRDFAIRLSHLSNYGKQNCPGSS